MNRFFIFTLLALSAGCPNKDKGQANSQPNSQPNDKPQPKYGIDTKRHIMTIPEENGHYLAVDLSAVHDCNPENLNERNGGSDCVAAEAQKMFNPPGCNCALGCGSACMPPPHDGGILMGSGSGSSGN